MHIERFEDIVAWQCARTLVRNVYASVGRGDARRDFGYRDQLCRAAVSVMCNIAEGFARQSRVEFKRYLDIARSSVREVQSLLYVGLDLGYYSNDVFTSLYKDAGVAATLIGKLIRSLPT